MTSPPARGQGSPPCSINLLPHASLLFIDCLVSDTIGRKFIHETPSIRNDSASITIFPDNDIINMSVTFIAKSLVQVIRLIKAAFDITFIELIDDSYYKSHCSAVGLIAWNHQWIHPHSIQFTSMNRPSFIDHWLDFSSFFFLIPWWTLEFSLRVDGAILLIRPTCSFACLFVCLFVCLLVGWLVGFLFFLLACKGYFFPSPRFLWHL